MNFKSHTHLKIIVQNLAIEYTDQGTGPILLCLHGWKDTLHTFNELTNLLSSIHRIISLNLPGFGSSETPKTPWTLSNYVSFVKEFIAKTNIQPDTLIGHSFGGRIIIKGVATKILPAKKIILIASAGIARDRKLKKLLLKTVAKTGKIIASIPPFTLLKEKLRTKLYKKIGSDYLAAGPLKETYVNIIKEDLTEMAKRITCPALLVWGADDTETPLTDGKRLSTLIKKSHLKIIKNASHFVHREHPQEVTKHIKNFLS